MGEFPRGSRSTRRRFLIRLGIAAGAVSMPLLGACSPPPAAAPAKPAEAKPTEAPRPAAPAKPGETAKPAEAKPAAPAAGKGTVTIDWWVPNFHAAGAKPLKEKFEAAHPNIKLNQIETVSPGLLEKVLTTLKGSTQPDLIDVANGWNPIFSQAGLVTDLSDRLGVLFRIALPLAAPAVVATGLFAFTVAWDEFLFALTFTQSAQTRTLPVRLAFFTGEYYTDWASVMAASVLMSIPVIAIFLSFQRYFLRGLAEGAVKG
jgi:ABC-type glycerol-3-phosphate transport system substrate-binding protein